jgi:signal transduction histidine kinase
MVDVLWRRGNVDGAIRLEALWGDVTRRLPVTLLCSYFMGNFYKDANPLQFLKICQAHDHVVPTERFVQLANPAERLREVTLLQHRARTLEKEISERKDLESALRLALRERSQIAEELRESLAREKDARARADASDAFKEIFLAILGHDFRNPLTTILTTARLMMMRAEVNPDTQKRLGRVLSSGLRMERMVEQLVDITRIRLAGGLPIHPLPNQDLVVLIAKNVDELRASAPAVPIVLHSPDTCFWRVDPERFEQVVANLVDNAVAHGDRSSPINVTLAVSKGAVSLSVQNCGVPISAELMHILFNPFARSTQRPIGSGGLGLGLYISDQIVAAHGGTLEVESTTGGTLFEVQLPQ